MIAVRGLRYVLPDRREILAGIDFELPPGRFLAVLGENGAGKTTLLDLLMGFRRRSAGTIQVMGQDPGTDPWESRARIGYLSEKHDLPGDWEAGDYLDFHRRFYSRFDAEEQRALVGALGVRRGARAGTLSAGEARRVQIAAALAARPELLIADEITALLDILGRRRFLRLRCWAHAKSFVVSAVVWGFLWAAWIQLFDPPSRLPYGLFRGDLPIAEVVFPAGAVVLAFWLRDNARRWCVTL